MGSLNELQWLRLIGYRGDKLIDTSRMASLREACFYDCRNVVTLTGLYLKLTNLRCLDVSGCERLHSLPGVGDLNGLEELLCRWCKILEGLPNLQKLTMLRTLDVSGCPLITELPGLGDLVALEELHAGSFESHLTLSNMVKLRNLQVLNIGWRRLKAVPGFESLDSLRKVVADFRELVGWPNLQQLTNMQHLDIEGWSSGLRGLDHLTMLQSLRMTNCTGVDKLPDFQNLQQLRIADCDFKDVSSLCYLEVLESLEVVGCEKLERLPDLGRMTRLESLEIRLCTLLTAWDCSSLGEVEATWKMVDDQNRPKHLQPPRFSGCGLVYTMSIGTFSQLQTLRCESLAGMELPDLSYFPLLKYLTVRDCDKLTRLMSREFNMHTVVVIEIEGCSSLATVPDLSTFPGLRRLQLQGCEGITRLSCRGPLTALEALVFAVCNFLEALPDLGMFPALCDLRVHKYRRLTMLSLSAAMPTLTDLSLCGCSGLKALPDLEMMFPALIWLCLEGCNGLTALTGNVRLRALAGSN